MIGRRSRDIPIDEGPATTIKEIVMVYLTQVVTEGCYHEDYQQFMDKIQPMLGRMDGYDREFKEQLGVLLSAGFRHTASQDGHFQALFGDYTPIRSSEKE